MSKKSEVEIRMEQDKCVDALNEAIHEVEAQLDELGDAGAEALETGDQTLIDQIMESICYINEQLTSLKSLKVSTKLQLITAHISQTMVGVLSTVGRTSAGVTMPNAKKLSKIQRQLAINSANSREARKEIAGIMKRSSPASRVPLTDEQRSQAMLFIQSHSAKKTDGLAGVSDIWNKVEAEKKTF